MSISPQSVVPARAKRSHKIPARFNDTVYNEAHYVEATQTQVLRTSTRSRQSSAGLKRDLDEEETDEEEVPKPTKASNRSSSHSKRSNKLLSNETSPVTSDTSTRAAAPTVTDPTTTKAAATTTSTTTTARPIAAQTWKPPSTSSLSAPPSLTPTTSTPNESKRIRSRPKKKKDFGLANAFIAPDGTSLIFKKPPTSASRKPDDIKKAATPQLATTILGASNNNQTAYSIPHNNNPSVGAKTFATPIQVLPGLPSQTTPNYINQGVRHFNGLTPNHQQYGGRMMINEQIYLPRSVGTIAPITTSLAQISNLSRRAPFVSRRTRAYLDYQNQFKLNNIVSIHKALVRIAQNLGFGDRLNLRAVSKTWRSIVECPDVWRRIIFDQSGITERYLAWHYPFVCRSKEIYCHEYEGKTDQLLAKCLGFLSLKRLKFKTLTLKQNGIVISVIRRFIDIRLKDERCTMRDFTRRREPLIVEWDVEVGVDELGLATVKFPKSSMEFFGGAEYKVEEEETADGSEKFFRVEFHDLKKIVSEPTLRPIIRLFHKTYTTQDVLKLTIRAI